MRVRGQPVGSRRALQHSNLLQCLAQCAEVTPYLLVMEFCPMVSRPLPGPPAPALRYWKVGLAFLLSRGPLTPTLWASHAPQSGVQVALHHYLPEAAWGRKEVAPAQRQRPSGLGFHCTLGEGSSPICLSCSESRRFS